MLEQITLLLAGGLTAVLIYVLVEGLRQYFADGRAAKLREAKENYLSAVRANRALRLQLNGKNIELEQYEQFHFDYIEEIRKDEDKLRTALLVSQANFNAACQEIGQLQVDLDESTKELNLLRCATESLCSSKKLGKIEDRVGALTCAQAGRGTLFTTNSNQDV